MHENRDEKDDLNYESKFKSENKYYKDLEKVRYFIMVISNSWILVNCHKCS
jgi:hypothetical protein